MDGTEKESSHAAAWITSIVALFIGYPLSAGPVAWFLVKVVKCAGPPKLFLLVYGPLAWLAEHNETFRHFMDWYGGLWHL